MGIKNLNSFLRKNCPNVYVEKHLSNYAFKKIAIDISLYMFKYKTIFGDNWVDAFINLISCLRRNEIHCVFVYDGKAPPDKEKEQEKRIKERQKIREKAQETSEAISQYYLDNIVTDFLKELYTTRVQKNKESLRLLRPVQFDIKIIEEELQKLKSQSVSITSEDFELTKKLFDLMAVPYVIADMEAETMCSHLCKSGLVYGVLSEDTDVLAYNTPCFLNKINTSDDTCIEIRIENILEELDISYELFRDLCIMCGTDYNSNIFRIGPINAFKLLKNNGSIEQIESSGIDTSVLKYKRVRELFTIDNNLDIFIPFCKYPDTEKLKRFLIENKSKVNLGKVIEAFSPKELVFEDK